MWLDKNHNGEWNPGEELVGVPITLVGPSGVTRLSGTWTAVTDETGRYRFVGIPEGTYTLATERIEVLAAADHRLFLPAVMVQ
jgi:hypothetical protein